ncbi:hypothetical protein ASPZODRAFT_2108113 [Penicilliopsis zonata CBS 506.65]|uniref:Cytochrome P450 n=1 Tax=Penicilliopsis zonata CBS 506.65 TaxID=1073090 RepID=A0A1L9SXE6_9EURO|nr:hypothetical protein ASPZODRAFT_2108113 [Penicilliopsis zonata CBS 506.65]OJJ51826.1 hypothetical protein ASPZODRAFT_2108113 [Penicilliopsis zonata CBS 506.65]
MAYLILLLILLVALILLRPRNLPPGPKGIPLLGNLFDLPPPGEQEWQHWLKHKDLYGPLSSVTVLGKTLIIINDRALAFQILEKNSATTSSRPRFTFANELCGWDRVILNIDYSPLLRTYRRAITRGIGTRESAARFHSLLQSETRQFLVRVLNSPEKFIEHNRTAAGAVVLKIVYGYHSEQEGDPLVHLARQTISEFSDAVAPKWLVDILPALKYIPPWMPGGSFHRVARRYRDAVTRLATLPFTFTKSQMSQGQERISFVSTLLRQGEEEEVVKWSAEGIYGGGSDTTVSVLEAFFLAMMLFPDVQRKAQAEIDKAFNHEPTLPSVSDRARLPYLHALIKETLRWHSIVPLGIPHRAETAHVVNSHLIPADAILIANVWAFNNDPAVYPRPRQFVPERFLPGGNPAPDPADVIFGFGRRVCPGRLIAETSIFLMVAHTLAVFDIKPAPGADSFSPHFTPGAISHPQVYPAVFTPRSQRHARLIRRFEADNPVEGGDSHLL